MTAPPKDDPAAVLAAQPTRPPTLTRRPAFELSLTFDHLHPAVMDLICYGQTPPPHIVLGEN